MEPRITLFDEPISALDAEMVNEVLDVMRETRSPPGVPAKRLIEEWRRATTARSSR